MKASSTTLALALGFAVMIGSAVNAFAQTETIGNPADETTASAQIDKPNLQVKEAKPETAGDLRAPSPKALDPNRRGYFQLGVGPAYGAGLKSDSAMYNVIGSYNFNLSNEWTAKILADTYFATGSVSSRLLHFGVGAEYYFQDMTLFSAVPYLGADVTVGFARNAIEQTATGAGLGIGGGVKFQAAALNFDVNAHYEQLTAQVGDAAPSVFAVRGAVTF